MITCEGGPQQFRQGPFSIKRTEARPLAPLERKAGSGVGHSLFPASSTSSSQPRIQVLFAGDCHSSRHSFSRLSFSLCFLTNCPFASNFLLSLEAATCRGFIFTGAYCIEEFDFRLHRSASIPIRTSSLSSPQTYEPHSQPSR